MGRATRYNSYDETVINNRKISASYGQLRQSQSVTSSFRASPLSPVERSKDPSIWGTDDIYHTRLYCQQVGLDETININFSTAGIVYDTDASPDIHDFRIDGTQVMLIQSDRVDFRQDLLMGGVSADIGADGTPFTNLYVNDIFVQDTSNNTPIVQFYRNDSTPNDLDIVGQLDFYGEDSGSNKTQYASITGLAVDVTGGTEDGGIAFGVMSGASISTRLYLNGSGTSLELEGGWSLKADSGTEIGIQVTNESITPGSAGTLNIPRISGSSGTAAAADGHFGSTEGCMGIYTNTTANSHLLVVRQDDGNWCGVLLTDNTLT